MSTVDLFGRPISGKKEFKAPVGQGVGRTRSSADIRVEVVQGDCLRVLSRLADEGVVFDSCVTDPPYHLTSTVSRFQKATPGGPTKAEQSAGGRVDSYGRLSKGFMGSRWDGGDIAFRSETWEKVLSVLRPGAFLVAFGGTRTYHRLVCAIEDAGFVVQDQILWLFGSGFPKRRDMLKPAFEPMCLAYKPGDKRTLQVDECRIGDEGGVKMVFGPTQQANGTWGRFASGIAGAKVAETVKVGGRWPANIVHDGSDEVLSMLPEGGGGNPDKSYSGSRPSGFVDTGADKGSGGPNGQVYGDSGSVARFFYCAKADSGERFGSNHPTVKPISLMRWLVRLVTPEGGCVLDPFAGTGSTGAAGLMEGVDSLLIENSDEYVADIHKKVAHYRGLRNRTLY